MLKAFNFQSFYLANTPGVNEIEELERPRIWVPNPILPQIIYIYFFFNGGGGIKRVNTCILMTKPQKCQNTLYLYIVLCTAFKFWLPVIPAIQCQKMPHASLPCCLTANQITNRYPKSVDRVISLFVQSFYVSGHSKWRNIAI